MPQLKIWNHDSLKFLQGLHETQYIGVLNRLFGIQLKGIVIIANPQKVNELRELLHLRQRPDFRSQALEHFFKLAFAILDLQI